MTDRRSTARRWWHGPLLIAVGLFVLLLLRYAPCVTLIFLGCCAFLMVVNATQAGAQTEPVQLPGPPPTIYDLGLLAYTTALRPVVHTDGPLPAHVRAVRPYAVLAGTAADWHTLRFALYDQVGDLQFSETVTQYLKSQATLVKPTRWLPITTAQDLTGWRLTLYADDEPLNAHDFQRTGQHRTGDMVDDLIASLEGDLLIVQDHLPDPGGGSLRAHLSGDGELSDDLVAVLEGARALSLDELLENG